MIYLSCQLKRPWLSADSDRKVLSQKTWNLWTSEVRRRGQLLSISYALLGLSMALERSQVPCQILIEFLAEYHKNRNSSATTFSWCTVQKLRSWQGVSEDMYQLVSPCLYKTLSDILSVESRQTSKLKCNLYYSGNWAFIVVTAKG